MASLFRHRYFVLLWTGQSVSELGSAVSYVALPLIAVVVLDAAPFAVGLVSAASSVAWLIVGLPAGAWVDRLPRRPLLIGTDLGRAVLTATIPAAWYLHVLGLTPLGWYVAGALPLSLGIAAFNVCVRSAVQVAAPDALLGRVTATARLLGRGAMPVGALGAGALAGPLGSRMTLVVLMVLLVTVPVWLLRSPVARVRDLARLAPAAPPTQGPA